MKFSIVELCRIDDGGGQMAERLGSRAINQTVDGSIPGRAKCVLGQSTSPYLPQGNVPVCTVSRSIDISTRKQLAGAFSQTSVQHLVASQFFSDLDPC